LDGPYWNRRYLAFTWNPQLAQIGSRKLIWL
jgi:hypothetical protein